MMQLPIKFRYFSLTHHISSGVVGYLSILIERKTECLRRALKILSCWLPENACLPSVCRTEIRGIPHAVVAERINAEVAEPGILVGKYVSKLESSYCPK